jgi:hypothetical protein
VVLRGPYGSLAAFEAGRRSGAARFSAADVLAWTDTASLPLLPGEGSAAVLARLREAPRLDGDDGAGWLVRPEAELHATARKSLMSFSDPPPEGAWPVYKGESFGIFEPDRGPGSYYAWAEPGPVLDWLAARRPRGDRGGGALPCLQARIAFRDVTNRTNRRTLIACLVPPRVFLTNKAPYLARLRGDARDEAFLLGILSSIPFDWYARRFIELNVNFFLLNPLPVPRPGRADPRWGRVVALAGRLAAADGRFADWAAEVGVPYGELPAEARRDMRCELDALASALYGLSGEQVREVFETFHEGREPGDDLDRVLSHFARWRA